MMYRLAICSILSLSVLGHSYADDAESFLGTWMFDAIEFLNESGEWEAFEDPRVGTNPFGYISYDSDGYMSVQLVHRDFPGSREHITAYFGTYEIIESESVVVHHTVGNLLGEPGSDQRRTYSFEGNTLTLMPDESIRLRWRKP